MTSFGRLPSAEEPVRVLAGDALTMLQSLPDGCVQCAITSPPYYSLRDNKCEGQIGLEATPELYIERLVAVFREVRRVLRKDGTCWLVMGDSYAREAGKGQHKPGDSGKQAYVYDRGGGRASATLNLVDCGMKAKDLLLLPHRLALALQAEGWWVRQDCVWQKPGAMPESVQDRPTRSHEYVFLLTKAAKYYYDPVAVRERAVAGHAAGNGYRRNEGLSRGVRGDLAADTEIRAFRNQRSVWTINTKPFAGTHFSSFPPALVEPCLRAGTSERGCCPQPQCGAPWKRITTGWTPTCAHDDPPVPCVCLDPFAGSGTVGAVALAHGRHAVLIELQEAYLPLIQARLAAVQTRMEGVE